MINLIETELKIENLLEYRLKIFNELVIARNDISSLNSFEILLRDLKVITNQNETKIVGIPGFPILVKVIYFNLFLNLMI